MKIPKIADARHGAFRRRRRVPQQAETKAAGLNSAEDYESRAAEVYDAYSTHLKKRFTWLRADLFIPSLAKDLLADAEALMKVLKKCGEWRAAKDSKLAGASRSPHKNTSEGKGDRVHTVRRHCSISWRHELRAHKMSNAASVTGKFRRPYLLRLAFQSG